MMWRVNPATSQVAVLSFPRDLWVTIAGRSSQQRINAAYERDNPQQLIDTIYQNFFIPTDHFVQVDFCAFKTLVDAVDGVTVPFATPVSDPTTGLYVPEAGCFTFNGDHALAYVRSRHLEYQTLDGEWHDRRHLRPRSHLAPAGLPPAHREPSARRGRVRSRRGGRADQDADAVRRHRPDAHHSQDARVGGRDEQGRPGRDHDVPDRVTAHDDPGQLRADPRARGRQHAEDPRRLPRGGDARRCPRPGLRHPRPVGPDRRHDHERRPTTRR